MRISRAVHKDKSLNHERFIELDYDDDDGTMPDVSSQWHTVRPWSPRFLLTVREITSVSSTFVLSAASSADGVTVEAGLASLGLSSGLAPDEEDNIGDALKDLHTSRSKLVHKSISESCLVSDALGRGLSVNVNGAAWKRVLMRMDEKGDEATLVLYGLMPGRQYDVEIGVVFGDGEEILHSRMVTQPQPGHTGHDDAADTSIDSISSRSTISNIPAATISSSTLSPHERTITIEEHASQLRSQLAQLNAERDSLTSQLKAARKESNKADAAKRSEIDALKRASEKHAAAEVRQRQKMRALQEAAKQAAAAAQTAEENAKELEAALPALRAHADEMEKRHESVASEARRAQEEADEAIRADRAKTELLRNELSGLTARLEKLQAKKGRLEKETLPKLEEQLSGIEREVELVARDAGAFEVVDNGPVGFDLGSGARVPGRMGNSAMTAPMNSPPAPIARQAGSKSPYSSNSTVATAAVSTLSSRAPPFDPRPTLGSRLGSAFQLQNGSARRLPQPIISSAHSYSQSLDIGGSVNGVSEASVGPTRQTSLPIPVKTPSQLNGR